MGTYLADIQAKNKAGANPPIAGIFVVYDLPDRDCAALASNGEYSIANNGVANYKAYIDAIRAQLVKYSDVHTILVIGRPYTSVARRFSLTSCRTRQLGQPGDQPQRRQMRQCAERLPGVCRLCSEAAQPAQRRHVPRRRYASLPAFCIPSRH